MAPRSEFSTDVVFALTGELRRNSRALKQLRLFDRLGLQVRVLDLDQPGASDGEKIVSLGRPPGDGPRFFLDVHRRMARAAATLPAKVYHASDLYVLPAMARAARRHGGRLVYDARELYPFVASTAGRPWVSVFWSLYEGAFIRKADAVFTVSDAIAGRLVAAYGIPLPPVLYNVPEWREVDRSHLLHERLGIPAHLPIVLHQGQVQRGRGGGILLEAFRTIEDAALVFMGGGSLRPALEAEARAAGAQNVYFLDAVPPDELLSYTASADIGVTLLEDTCLNHRFALPNKLFEYLMAGLPVVASDLPEIHRVVAGHEVGELVDPGDPASVTAGIRRLLDDPTRRHACAARARSACETFRWEGASERFTEIYSRLTGPRQASSC